MLKNQRAGAAPPVEQTHTGAIPMLPMNQRIETIFKTGFECMRQGITGDQFALWLCNSGEFAGGREAFEFLKPGGAAGLVTMASAHPVGARILADASVRPQLDLFLSAFFSFDAAAEPVA